jgi:hypothetical protein
METNKKYYTIQQLGHGSFGVSDSIEGVKTESKKWLTSESYAEIDELDLSYSTHNSVDGDVYLLECSETYFNEVNKMNGGINYDIIDGVVYSSSEIDEFGDLIELEVA